MINHARTLLLNLSGQAGFHVELGEEIVPAEFQAITLSQSLQNARRILFGSSPDRAMLNYRGRQLMALLHSNELEEFVLELDPRITYDFLDQQLFDELTFLPRITQTAGTADQISLVGTTSPPDDTGQMLHVWDLHVVDNTTITATLQYPYQQLTESYSLDDGVSELLDLPGTEMQFRMHGYAGARWRIRKYTRPARSLGEIAVALETVGASTLIDIFGLTDKVKTEPFKTFYNLWQDHRELAFKLGGFLLATIYQTEALRVSS